MFLHSYEFSSNVSGVLADYSKSPPEETPRLDYLAGYIGIVVFFLGLLGTCLQVHLRRTQARSIRSLQSDCTRVLTYLDEVDAATRSTLLPRPAVTTAV